MKNSREYVIAPSILSANFAILGEEVHNVIEAGADVIHVDVMDNHYVPNLTVGPLVCRALRNYGITTSLNVHLMVKPVDSLIAPFAEAGATCIIFHPEATDHIDRTIQLINDYGCRAGLALNPATSLTYLAYVLDKIDILLLMTVNPGFGGQQFIMGMMDKISVARELIEKRKCSIQLGVDGGINEQNIVDVAKAGADFFVMGSAIFGKKNYKNTIQDIRSRLDQF